MGLFGDFLDEVLKAPKKIIKTTIELPGEILETVKGEAEKIVEPKE